MLQKKNGIFVNQLSTIYLLYQIFAHSNKKNQVIPMLRKFLFLVTMEGKVARHSFERGPSMDPSCQAW